MAPDARDRRISSTPAQAVGFRFLRAVTFASSAALGFAAAAGWILASHRARRETLDEQRYQAWRRQRNGRENGRPPRAVGEQRRQA
jgi:hypothetical protein